VWGLFRRRSRAVQAPLGGAPALFLALAVAFVSLFLAWYRGGPGRPATRPPAAPGPAASASDWLRWGDFQLGRRQLRAAEEAFGRATRLDPTLAQARLRLAWVHSAQMRRREVLADFAALAELGPLTFDQVLIWTQVRCSIWDPDKTTPQLNRLLEADPGDRWVRLALAEGLRRQGRPTEALEVLKVVGESDADARVIRARLAIDRGDLAAAEAVLANGPADHAEAAELRGRIALARRDATAAAEEFRRGLTAQPDHHGCTAGLAQALRLSGRDEEAGPLVETVHRQSALIDLLGSASGHKGPPELKLLRALGAACEALQLVPEARAWYGLALAREPLNPEVQVALYRLRHQRSAPPP
jgi:tetratricopeptide (TPR) repeat protein